MRKGKARSVYAFPPEPHPQSLEHDYVSAITAYIAGFRQRNALKMSPFIVRGERIVA